MSLDVVKERLSRMMDRIRALFSKDNCNCAKGRINEFFRKENRERMMSNVRTLGTAEGRAQALKGFQMLSFKKRIGICAGGILGLLVVFRIACCSSNVVGGKVPGVEQILEDYCEGTTLRDACRSMVAPTKGCFYLNQSSDIQVFQAKRGVAFAVPVGEDGVDQFLDKFRNEPLFRGAVDMMKKVSTIAIVTDKDYSAWDFARNRLYRFLGSKEYKLANGAVTLMRTFQECSEETTYQVCQVLKERRHKAFMKWFEPKVKEIDVDFERSIFIPKSLGVVRKNRIGALGEGEKFYRKYKAFCDAQKKGDMEKCSAIMGVSESSFSKEHDFEAFLKELFCCDLEYAEEVLEGTVRLVIWNVEERNDENRSLPVRTPVMISGSWSHLYCLVFCSDYQRVIKKLEACCAAKDLSYREKKEACRKFLSEYENSYPVPQGGFSKEKKSIDGLTMTVLPDLPIKSICGLTFGESPRATEAKLGKRLTEEISKQKMTMRASYMLPKPFRHFTEVETSYIDCDETYVGTPMKAPELYLPEDRKPLIVLSKLVFTGKVDMSKYSRESCLEELKVVKDMLEEKFNLKFKPMSPADGFSTGDLNIQLEFKDGTFIMEIAAATLTNSENVANFLVELQARKKRQMEAEDKKKDNALLSESAGKDVL